MISKYILYENITFVVLCERLRHSLKMLSRKRKMDPRQNKHKSKIITVLLSAHRGRQLKSSRASRKSLKLYFSTKIRI